MYAATDEYGAFIETLGRRLGMSAVALAGIAERRLARVVASRALRLVNLTGPGLARLGADGRLFTGDYRVAQRWSLAFHEHPDRADGLLYPSRHDPSRTCIAVYERAQADVQIVPLTSLAAPENASLLADILATYGFDLIDDLV